MLAIKPLDQSQKEMRLDDFCYQAMYEQRLRLDIKGVHALIDQSYLDMRSDTGD